MALPEIDPEVAALTEAERLRQNLSIQLVPSHSMVSAAILDSQGSVWTNLAMEGYPGRRYFPGCELADEIERLAIRRARALFGAEHANVQPHAGVTANLAVYLAALAPGDGMLAMSLQHGGHLSHGYELSLSGRFYRTATYSVDRATEQIDYDRLRDLACRERPKLIIAGGSAYPRTLDFARFRAICDEAGALLLVDQAHIGGLVAAGVHPSPVPHADFVTGTTYKTLGGGKGAYILCKARFAAAVDRAVFPGVQGSFGPHVVAAKAVTFGAALSREYQERQRQVVANARYLAARFRSAGWRLVAGGTDTHLLVVDVGSRGLTGRAAEEALADVGIYANRNLLPFDTRPARMASGLRIGTPAVTARGFGLAEMDEVAGIMLAVLDRPDDAAQRNRARARVEALCRRYPIYGGAESGA